uniref:Uncharacterized protein n=2 Tax=Rhodnius prolixus TaxID=13249 RepID=T1HFE8_RHOPR
MVKGITLKSSLRRKGERKTLEKRNHRTVIEDYQDANVPINYDLDYYPYRSYLYDNEEEFTYGDEPHNIVKKHKTKRRGYNKEKNKISRNNYLNSQKVKIKSQRRSKQNFKTLSRRNIQSENLGEKINFRRQDYLSDYLSANRNSPYYDKLANGKSYKDDYNIEGQALRQQPELIENYNFDGYKSNKKSPYDYLHINNRSHDNLNDFSDKLKYEFQPNDFNYKTLRRVLGEAVEINAPQYPQCPAYRPSEIAIEDERNREQEEREELLKGNPRETLNYNRDMSRDRNYYRKRLERGYIFNHEESKGKPVKAILRKKRAQKSNVFTLTFPGAENVGSYISMRDWQSDLTQQPMCTKCTTKPVSTCSTSPQCIYLTTTCTEETTTCPTTVDQCTTTVQCTTTEECTTQLICSTETTKCAPTVRNFKELNEGNRVYMDLSNLVSNVFHTVPVYNSTSNGSKSKRQKFVVPYVLQQNAASLSPVNNKNNEIKIIKLEPHNLIERSKNTSRAELDNDNIFIVKLLKDLSSAGKLLEIPLQSQQSFYSVPYAPRERRQLAIMKNSRVGDG